MCRVTSRNFCPLGLVEALPEGVPLATSLNQPDEKGQLVVRCLNPSKQPLELKSGAVICTYTGVEAQKVQDQEPLTTPAEQTIPTGVPSHVEELYQAARPNCGSEEQEKQLARLLRQYAPVFSLGEGDVGLTQLVEHSIPVVPGTRPIRQPPSDWGQRKRRRPKGRCRTY